MVGYPTYDQINYRVATVYWTWGADPSQASTLYKSGTLLNPDGGLKWNEEQANC